MQVVVQDGSSAQSYDMGQLPRLRRGESWRAFGRRQDVFIAESGSA